MTTERFLEVLNEEMDKMIKDQGLILDEKFRVVMRKRLLDEIRLANAGEHGVIAVA